MLSYAIDEFVRDQNVGRFVTDYLVRTDGREVGSSSRKMSSLDNYICVSLSLTLLQRQHIRNGNGIDINPHVFSAINTHIYPKRSYKNRWAWEYFLL